MKTLVIIPTYNEADNLRPIVERVRESVADVDILVADDNSPDGTGKIADDLAEHDPAVHILHRQAKNGLGAAYIAGFAWGLDRGYELLVEMDADGSHQPEQLSSLLGAARDGADLVIGSRWVRGGSVVNWPKRREFLSRAGNIYARIALGLPARDATGGYRVFHADALRMLDLPTVESQGYCFQVDLTRRTYAAGLAVREVPITFVERVCGESKMSGAIVREALWRVTMWGIIGRWGRVKRLAWNRPVSSK